MFKVGQKLTVRHNHPFHAGKCGTFEFMGGPNGDVVVIATKETMSYKQLIAVGISDVVSDSQV